MKAFKAIIWIANGGQSGKRCDILANDLAEAKAKLLSQYGEGCRYSLWDEDEARRPR